MNCLSSPQKRSKSEQGSVLLTALVILLLLTLIGVSGMNISSTDIEITRNYRVYKENLYRAEGIAMRAVKLKLTNEIDYSAVVDSNNLSDDAFVQSSEKPSVLNNLNHTVIKNNWNSTSGYMVFENAWEPGDFVVFSRSRKNGGYAFVEIGIEQD